MFNTDPFPGVGDMHEPVGCLNDGGIAVFAWFAFQDENRLPMKSILAPGHIERGAAAPRVIVDQQVRSILQGYGIDAAVRIGKRCSLQRRPRLSLVGRMAGDDASFA